ncbi:unnamed protein product [Cuscuta campestris]|uniref:Phospholipase-like protein n=1 Tax=Cuscuta campestris TaxID=132261 RepID=A0A484LNH2_9ASTE|nr:unnamed protein product [Cuscuta campestris]
MSRRSARPRSTRAQGGNKSKDSDVKDLLKEVTISGFPQKSSSPPPDLTQMITRTITHKYETRRTKEFLSKSRVASRALESSRSSLEQPQRTPLRSACSLLKRAPATGISGSALESQAIKVINASSKPNGSVIASGVNHPVSGIANEPENKSDQIPTPAAAAAVHPTKSDNFPLTEILLAGSDDDEDVTSTQSSLLEIVSGYKLSKRMVPFVKQVFAKYGDIVKDSIFKSVEYRSSVLETICSICIRLKSVKFQDITFQELQSMLNVVNDLEPVKVEIGWLQSRLKELCEAKSLKRGFPGLLIIKTKTLQEIEGMKKAMEDARQEYEGCLAKCQLSQERLKKLEDAVATAQVEVEKIDASYSDTKTKLRCFYTGSLLHDVL